MPIGIVTDNDFEQELASITGEIVVKERPGRKEGDNNVPDSLRKIIGETSEIEGRQEALALAEMFGISPSSVSAYAKGATSTATINEPKPSITKHIKARKEKIISRAHDKLSFALGSITKEKLQVAKATELSTIAKDMSAIIRNLEPEHVDDNTEKRPQFVVFAPTFVKEEHFDTINVSE